MEKVKNHKIAKLVAIGVVAFALINLCWWASARADNVSNDGVKYGGDYLDKCVGSVDRCGHDHGRTIRGDIDEGQVDDVSIGSTNYTNYGNGIKGTDNKADHRGKKLGINYDIDDIFFDVDDNRLTMHYKTYTYDLDTDGEVFTFIICFTAKDTGYNYGSYRWPDHSDSGGKMDSEHYDFSGEELDYFLCGCCDRNGRTLEQLIKDGELKSISLSQIYCDDFRF